MRVALGPLNWAPATFWKATPHEFVAACEGGNSELMQGLISNKRERMKALEEKARNGHNN